MRAPLALLAAAFATTLAAAASADIAVPGRVETCTMDKQARADQECYPCSAFHGNHTHCTDSLSGYGFAEVCRTGGASVWSEIWCRPKSPSAPVVPPEVLGQLASATHKMTPPAAPPAAPTAAPTADPAPTAAPAPAPTAAPLGEAPGPQPQPPPPGCACTVGDTGTGPLLASLLSAAAAAAVAVRRRTKRQ